MTATDGKFEAIEARLWAILAPYRDRLEDGSVYGLVTLRAVGAKQHDFFAGVRVAPRHVAFHLMPVYSHPALLEDVSPALRKRMKGKTTFDFSVADEDLFAELDELTARSFAVYMEDHAT
jgi:hypothetical protein